jgi:hypothetical protein
MNLVKLDSIINEKTNDRLLREKMTSAAAVIGKQKIRNSTQIKDG